MSKKQPSFIDLASEYFAQYDIFPKSSFQGFAEKLNSRYTVLIIAVALAMLAPNNYFESKIACYLPTVPNMKVSFVDMFHEYCFINGTILLLPGEHVPTSEYTWSQMSQERKISFYQWVPIILLLQMILFLFPSSIWKKISSYTIKTDFDKVIEKAVESRSELDESKRVTNVKTLATEIEKIIHLNHFGAKKLRFVYLFVKVLYLLNVVIQLVMMFLFLFRSQPFPTMSMNLNEEEGVFLAFPRKVFCHMPDVMTHMGYVGYTGQCILYMNIFYHVIYTFLYYWFMVVSVVTLLSIFVFCLRSFRYKAQFSFIKHLLKVSKCYEKENKASVEAFIGTYLKGDGVFLIRKLNDNVKSFISGDVVAHMYTNYRDSIDL